MPPFSASRLDFLVDDEAKLIGFMAGVLQISEYEFFRIAYQNWFNHQITEQRLDFLFKDFRKLQILKRNLNRVTEDTRRVWKNYRDFSRAEMAVTAAMLIFAATAFLVCGS